MFSPHAVDERTRDLIRSHLVRPRNHWPAADLTGTPVLQALALLVLSGNDPRAPEHAGLRQVALAHCLAALLVQLALVEPAGAAPAPGPTHEAYTWFRDHIEEQFRSWHQVSQYADRLGYSTRTLNRLARRHTGLSAKELIDERVVLEAKRHSATPTPPCRRSPSNSASTTRRTSPPTPAPDPPDTGHLSNPEPLGRYALPTALISHTTSPPGDHLGADRSRMTRVKLPHHYADRICEMSRQRIPLRAGRPCNRNWGASIGVGRCPDARVVRDPRHERAQLRRCAMNALLVGYARCSTDQQDLTAQHDALLAMGVDPSGSTSTTA